MAIESATEKRGVLAALDIRPEEAGRTALLFIYLFLASIVFTTGRTARDALFLSEYPSKWLPHMFVLYGAASAAIIPLYSYLNERFRRDIFNSVFPLLLGLSYIVSWVLVLRHWSPVFPILYVWVEVTSNLLIVQFWTMSNDLHDPREAKRLFGIIGSSRMIGIAFCGIGVRLLVGYIGTAALLLVNAAALILITFVVTQIGKRYFNRPQVARVISLLPEKSAPPESPWKSKYALLIVAMIVTTFIATTLGDYQFKIIARENYDADKLAAFFALFYIVVGAAAFFFHFFVSSRLLARFGVIFGLLVMPVLIGSNAVWLALSGGALLAAAALKLSDIAFQFTINDSSLNLLYYPFPANLKARIKAALEGSIKPISYGIGGIVLIFLAPKLGPVKLSFITIPIVVVWIIILFVLRPYYLKALVNSLATRHIEPGAIEITASPEVIAQLSNAARSDSDYLFEFAIDELTRLDAGKTKKLLEELAQNPKRRSAALMKLAELGATEDQGRAYLNDPDVNVRAAAIWAVASARQEESIDELAPFLNSSEHIEADAACAALICHAEFDGVLVAGEFLHKLLDGDEGARLRAAAILGQAQVKDFYRPVRRLLHDPSLEVRKEAIRAAGMLRNRFMLDDLIAAIGDPWLRPLAIDAVEGYGGKALEKLSEALGDEKLPINVREHMPRMIRKINRPEAVTALWSRADTPNEKLRIPILHHGERLQEKWSLSIDRGRILNLLDVEGVSAARWMQRWRNLRPLAAADPLVREYIDQALYWCGRRIISLLRFLYGPSVIGRIRYNLESGGTALKAQALETLDNLLPQEEREWVVPFMDTSDRSKAAGVLSARFPEGKEDYETTMQNAISGDDDFLAAAIFRARIQHSEQFKIGEIISIAAASRAHASPLLQEECVAALVRLGYADGEIEKEARALNAAPLLEKLHEHKSCSDLKAKEDCKMLTNLERVIFLKKVPLFESVPGEDLARLAGEASLESFPQGKDIFHKDDLGDAMFLIVEGKVSVRLDEKELTQLEGGDVFGEMAMLDQEPRSATITTLSPVTVLRIKRDDFFEIMADRPEIARGILRVLSVRMRKANEEIRKLVNK